MILLKRKACCVSTLLKTYEYFSISARAEAKVVKESTKVQMTWHPTVNLTCCPIILSSAYSYPDTLIPLLFLKNVRHVFMLQSFPGNYPLPGMTLSQVPAWLDS